MELEQLTDILKETLILTTVVTGIMLIVDLVRTRTGRWAESTVWRRRRWSIPLAALLGAIPGCVGGYVTVSLHDKKVIPFGALLAMAVATMGDETFMMLAMFPKTAIAIMTGLAIAGTVSGYLWELAVRRWWSASWEIRTSAPSRAVHEHSGWKHSLVHALKVFIWAFCIMLAVGIAGQYVDLEALIGRNAALMVVLAVLIGLIPQSGPHMVFVTLFAQGMLPLPVLLASCISQEGHAGLPLIAGDRSAFIRVKAVKIVMALVTGWCGLLFV